MLPTATADTVRPVPGDAASGGRWDRWAPWGLVALLLYVLYAALEGWRYFPGFSGDHAWYLQVALRVSRGEALYRDVAWAYGPLPAHVLAALFRWGGPDAAWASLVNGLLAVAGIALTYAVARSLLAPAAALVVTVFAAVVGPNPWSGLFYTYYYVYTQAIAWAAVASLAALAAALRWLQSGHSGWLLVAGMASALAILSKPEFGLTALAVGAAALAAGRAPAGAWLRYLAAAGLLAAAGFGVQAVQAGLWPVWRGYSGYDQLIGGSSWLWGTRLGNRRLLLGGYALWLALAALWASRCWPQRRRLFLALASAASLVVLAVAVIYLLGGSAGSAAALLRQGSLSQVQPANLLALAALPWAPLLPLLLAAGWLARGRSLPPAWWAVWAFAVVASLRLVLTGYANPFAVAPSLAVFWVWIEDRLAARPERLRSGRRLGLAALGGLALLNLTAQWAFPNELFRGPRAQVDTALGPIKIAQALQADYQALAALVVAQTEPGAPVFATGWGAQWYLLTGRINPTAFDVLLPGVGAGASEAGHVAHALQEHPPQAVLLPAGWQAADSNSSSDQSLAVWMQQLAQDYVEQTPAGVRSWRLWSRLAK